jgi:DNA repair photolyase
VIFVKPKRHIRYEKVQIKSVLNAVKAPSMPFEWSINPYRGCMHGCSFCYARSTHSFLGEQADDAFQNHIFVKSDAPARAAP